MAEIEPVIWPFDQKTAVDQHFQPGHRVLRGGLLQEIQAEITPDDRGQIEQITRPGGQAMDAFEDDLLHAWVAP